MIICMDIFAIYGAWRCSRKSMVGSYGRKRVWVFWISITISHINACCFRLLFEKSFHMCDEKCNSDCLYWNKKDHIVVGCLNSLEHHLVALNIPFMKILDCQREGKRECMVLLFVCHPILKKMWQLHFQDQKTKVY